MLFITHRLQAYFLKITGRWPPFTSMDCCKRVWKLPYTRLRRSSSIAATSSTVACLSSWIVMIRLQNTRSFRNPPQEKVWYSEVGRPSRPSDVAETRDKQFGTFHEQQPYCFVPYEMTSSPLLFPLLPTTTSYRAGAIFQFEMCQSAPRHPTLCWIPENCNLNTHCHAWMMIVIWQLSSRASL